MSSVIAYTKAKIDTMLALLSPLASPTFTGDPKVPTATAGDNDTSIANTAFVTTAVATAGASSLVSPTFTGDPKAPTAAVGDSDTSIATTGFVATSFAPLLSPTLTGDPKAPTATAGDNDTSIANTAFVTAAVATAGAAALVTPTFTGDPKVPTAAVGDNDTSIASTAFVQAEKLKQLSTQIGTAYTLVLADANKVIEASNASAQAMTVPPNSAVAFPIGTTIQMTQVGVGKPSFVAGAGVTLNTPGGTALGCRLQWSTITLRKRATDLWVLSDDVG